MLELLPDPEDMTPKQLRSYQTVLLQKLAELDAKEPTDRNSDAYEAWGNAHEELEDLLDEVLDRLDDLQHQ